MPTRRRSWPSLQGPVVTGGERGGLGNVYHWGGTDAVQVHLAVKSDWSLKPVYDVIAMLPRHRLSRPVDRPRQPPRRLGDGRRRSADRPGRADERSARRSGSSTARAGGRSGPSSTPAGTARSRGCSARPNGPRPTPTSSSARRSSTSTPTITAAASSLPRAMASFSISSTGPPPTSPIRRPASRCSSAAAPRILAQSYTSPDRVDAAQLDAAKAERPAARPARLGLRLLGLRPASRHPVAQPGLRRRGLRRRQLSLALRQLLSRHALRRSRPAVRRARCRSWSAGSSCAPPTASGCRRITASFAADVVALSSIEVKKLADEPAREGPHAHRPPPRRRLQARLGTLRSDRRSGRQGHHAADRHAAARECRRPSEARGRAPPTASSPTSSRLPPATQRPDRRRSHQYRPAAARPRRPARPSVVQEPDLRRRAR